MKRQDFILNSNGDFPLQDTVINGVWQDTPYGDSDEQHKADIIVYDLGWLKSSPTLGFGVMRYSSSEFNLNTVNKNLQIHMQKDGYNVLSGCVVPKGSGFEINTSKIESVY